VGQDEKGDILATYKDLGITRQKMQLYRQLATIPKAVLRQHLDAQGAAGIRRLAAEYAGAATDDRLKIRTDNPARAAWAIAKSCSPGFVEELVGLARIPAPRRGTGSCCMTAPERDRLVRDLARRDDWRQALAALDLPEAEARDLAVLIVRVRVWGAVGRHVARASR
jgi:hypothetical protein